jgi:hypothetical protein
MCLQGYTEIIRLAKMGETNLSCETVMEGTSLQLAVNDARYFDMLQLPVACVSPFVAAAATDSERYGTHVRIAMATVGTVCKTS